MKKRFLSGLVLTFCLLIGMTSCKTDYKKQEQAKEDQVTSTQSLPTNAIYVLVNDKHGQHHPDNYVQVQVTLSGEDNKTAHIVVSSPVENTQTSCSMETVATKVGPTKYQGELKGIKVDYYFEKDMLTIDTVNEGDRGVLREYCETGATLYGNYKLYAEN